MARTDDLVVAFNSRRNRFTDVITAAIGFNILYVTYYVCKRAKKKINIYIHIIINTKYSC